MITTGSFSKVAKIQEVDMLSMLTSAAIHDYEHG
jgi:hypothetical protein